MEIPDETRWRAVSSDSGKANTRVATHAGAAGFPVLPQEFFCPLEAVTPPEAWGEAKAVDAAPGR